MLVSSAEVCDYGFSGGIERVSHLVTNRIAASGVLSTFSVEAAAGGDGAAPRTSRLRATEPNRAHTATPGDLRAAMVRRGSTVRVRQRASQSSCKLALCSCLTVERADTFRTHSRYARRTASLCDVRRHRPGKPERQVTSENSLPRGNFRCLSGREADFLTAERGHEDPR